MRILKHRKTDRPRAVNRKRHADNAERVKMHVAKGDTVRVVRGDDKGKDSGGLDFPECKEPDYWDFVYFSFTLGMTFQTSDVDMTSRKMRRVTIGHCLAAFVFNIGVLAFTINVLGGG